MPGKTLAPSKVKAPSSNGFNEAPAKCRGKRTVPCERSRRNLRFNEAPAKCRGKRIRGRGTQLRLWGFNEAPAKCRGKRAGTWRYVTASGQASMRPQRNAGEKLDQNPVKGHRVDFASMRPQRNAGENHSCHV